MLFGCDKLCSFHHRCHRHYRLFAHEKRISTNYEHLNRES